MALLCSTRNLDLFLFIISMQAGKVKLKNVSWAIAGLTLKTTKGKFDHMIFIFSGIAEYYVDKH